MYGRLDVSEARRLKALADENVELKKRLAKAMLDNARPKDINKKMYDPHSVRAHGEMRNELPE